MIIAKEKKQANIAEYILYIWQLEDILRAYNLDINKIENNIIKGFDVDDKTYNEIKAWYSSLIEMMKEEKIVEKGHLIFIKNTINDLYQLHLALIQSPQHFDYLQKYENAEVLLNEFKTKSPNAKNQIELCFTALYGKIILLLQKKKISEETNAAFSKISELISLLAIKYHQIEKGEIDFAY